jgi:diacylglycerol kinase (ATP)
MDVLCGCVRVAIIRGTRATPERIRPFQAAGPAEWTDTLSADVDAVLIFGGDGSVHRHLPQLATSKVPFLVVPTGSGNDFASSLGIHNPQDALRLWREFVANGANVRKIDLGVIRDSEGATHLFCNVANLGLDSEINRRANELSPFWRANGGYILSLFPALFSYRAAKVKIVADQKVFERPMLLAVAANGTRYGRGLNIAPRANMEDGFLDLCFVRDAPKIKVAALFPLVYFGQHLHLREVEYFRFKHLTVEAAMPLNIYADGEFLCRTPAEITVIPAGLSVIAPRI